MDKSFLVSIINTFMTEISKGVINEVYKESDIIEKCVVCDLKLVNGDLCRISDCKHNFHAECIVRYCKLIKNKCPVCDTEILDKLA